MKDKYHRKLISLFTVILCLNANVSAQCYSPGQTIDGSLIVSTTGIPYLDSIINVEHEQLEVFFGLDLDFRFMAEANGPNAYFHPQCDVGCTGTLYLGLSLFFEKFVENGNTNIVKAIMAHEFGHAIQNMYGWSENGKRPELHSDFMAGYYIGKQKSLADSTSLYQFVYEFYDKGSNNPRDFFNPDFHGTKEERGCAFLEGFAFAQESNVSVQEASIVGLEYIQHDNPCAYRKYNVYAHDIANEELYHLRFKCSDNKKYGITFVDHQGKKYAYDVSKNHDVFIPNLAFSFIYYVTVYEKSLLNGYIEIAKIKLNPNKGIIKELEISKGRISSRDKRINNYLTVLNNQSYNEANIIVTSKDEDLYIYDSNNIYLGKVNSSSSVYLSSRYIGGSFYFNVYKLEKGELKLIKYCSDYEVIIQKDRQTTVLFSENGTSMRFK